MKTCKLLWVVIGCLFTGFVGGEEPFYFIQITDPQLGMMEDNKSFVKEIDLMKKAASAINKLDPAFIVITGDFVHNGKDEAQLDAFNKLTKLFREDIPLYLLPGNHDIEEDGPAGYDAYLKRYNYDRFTFRYGTTCFTGINTQLVRLGLSPQEEEQYEWLKNTLESEKGCRRHILFGHHPFFLRNRSEDDSYQNIPLARRAKYLDLFQEHNVTHLFVGHLHYNHTATEGNLTIQATSALGQQIGNDLSGIRIVNVYPDRIESTYYPIDKIPAKSGLN